MTRVRCSVDNCEFWGEGEVCNADAIWVKNNTVGELTFDMEVADESGFVSKEKEGAEGCRSTSAETSWETCCETMRPRSEH